MPSRRRGPSRQQLSRSALPSIQTLVGGGCGNGTGLRNRNGNAIGLPVPPTTALITPGPVRHCQIPDLPVDGSLFFEFLFFIYLLIVLFIQYINIYKTVWWYPYNHPASCTSLATKAGAASTVHYTALILARLVLLTLCGWVLCWTLVNLFRSHSVLNLLFLGYPFGVYVPLYCFHQDSRAHLLLTDYVVQHQAVEEAASNVGSLARSKDFLSLLLESLKEQFNNATPIPTHSCPLSPDLIRNEVECLKADFNHRIKEVLFNSLFSAYYVAFLPLCFVKSTQYYDMRWSCEHLIMVWINAFADSFNRRSVDFDLLCGHYNNDGTSPPFGLLRSSSVEEKSLSHRNSLDTNLTSMLFQNLSEEDLVTQILEKHKIDHFSSGTDIKMCLDILLKCSEDLKKCTDIIKQCIKKKSGGSISEGSGNEVISNSETVYMNVMTRLAYYLRKLPFEFMQSGNNETVDLTELINNIPNLQLTPFSPLYGTEQPPKYEDIVHLSALDSGQFQTVELQDDKHNFKQTDIVKTTPNNTDSLCSLEVNDPGTLKPVQLQSPLLTINHLENVSSGNLMETLYIEEESDGKKSLLDKEQKAENGQGQEPLQVNEHKEFSDHDTYLKKCPVSMQNEIGKIFEKPIMVHPSKEDSKLEVPTTDLRDQRHFVNPNSQEEIDKLLMDLESFSQKMETSLGEPLAKGKSINSLNSHSHLTAQSHKDLEPKPIASSAMEKVSPSCLTRIIENNGHKMEEEDRALLLRIMESIEDFAQELVECKSGRGSLSQEKEMMQILQETLTTSSQPTPSVCRSPVGEKPKDSTSVVLIQQTPEVIKIQNKPEKKPATSFPPAATLPSSPQPASPVPCVSDVVNTPLSINIPQFYFPEGLPDTCSNHEQILSRIETAFKDIEDQKADIHEMGRIAKVCGCPLYWKAPMFRAAGGEKTGFVTAQSFIAMWKKLLSNRHDDAAKFIWLLAKPSCSYLEQEDFIPLLQDVVDTHPGLTFLKDAPEFHSRYITTVVQRIFYTVNRSWSGKITSTEIRKSNFLQTLALLEEEEDINQITDYFSYEHFYVIYCKFWELDGDHDLYISQADLSRYNDQASSNRIIERIFSGAVTRGKTVQKEGRMSYADFVWFLISEEDKRNPTSIEYWFRCMDVDGDGILSMYELEYFYEEQCERMEAMGIEPLPFHDLLCQMLDLVKPASDGRITLRDLKRCRMAHIFYDTFFNLEKYLDHEQRDPFAVQKDVENDGPEPSDWDRFAAEEYEALVTEESAQVQLQEGSFEDYESDEPVSPSELGNKGNKIVTSSLSEKCGKLQSVDEE